MQHDKSFNHCLTEEIFWKHDQESLRNTVEHNLRVCLYIAYIACGSALLYIKTLYFFLTVLALSAAATVANIKIHYDAKTPQFAIFGTRVICVFHSNTPAFPITGCIRVYVMFHLNLIF